MDRVVAERLSNNIEAVVEQISRRLVCAGNSLVALQQELNISFCCAPGAAAIYGQAQRFLSRLLGRFEH